MSDQHLASYLNDHLAGSVTALALLEHLEKTYADTATGRFAVELRADIMADRQELEALMARLHVEVRSPRKAATWLAEKMTEVKLRLDDPAGGALHRLEALEAVSVGIEGKRLLWRALAAAAEGTPGIRGTDYGRLEQRAEEQRQRVEAFRLEAAREALGGTS
jgi:hypothetical protein